MKIAILVVVVLILLGGGGFIAASAGLVHVPGISPTKFGKPLLASKDETRGLVDTLAIPINVMIRESDKLEKAKKEAAAKQKPVVIDTKPELGDAKIAQIWNEVDPQKLAEMTTKWPEQNLAKVLLKMDSDQVTALLGVLPADRAEKISLAIQKEASKLPPPAATAS